VERLHVRRSDWVEAPSPLYTSLMTGRGTPYSKPWRATATGSRAGAVSTITSAASAGASQPATRVRTRSAMPTAGHLLAGRESRMSMSG
jgi:hypothetical protein